MKSFKKDFSQKEFELFATIAVTISQVTIGVAYASLFIAPLDFLKGVIILISLIASILLWWSAWWFTKQSKYLKN